MKDGTLGCEILAFSANLRQIFLAIPVHELQYVLQYFFANCVDVRKIFAILDPLVRI